MAKNKEVRPEIHYPPTLEHPKGRVEEILRDGTTRPIDKIGNPILPAISDTQLEAWKKAPKEQALKEALELFRSQGMDVAEQRVKLEIIKFIAELQGATQPSLSQGMQMLSVHINIAQPPVKIKDVIGKTQMQ